MSAELITPAGKEGKQSVLNSDFAGSYFPMVCVWFWFFLKWGKAYSVSLVLSNTSQQVSGGDLTPTFHPTKFRIYG